MDLTLVQYLLGAFSGGLVGLTLGLFGGGGSILAVPLMVYLVGVKVPHIALGTSAFVVAANAAINLAGHARYGNVKWRCALTYSAAGILGAFIGSSVGKLIDGQKLLLVFALLMLLVAAMMFRRRKVSGDPDATCTLENAPKTLGFGLATGVFSGFFGIGGGFLIVPGLLLATGMPLLNAIASSLVAVTAFGLTTALNYAWSGMVEWHLALVFIAGGLVGGAGGARLARRLSQRRGILNIAFAVIIMLVAFYMIWKTALGA